MAVARQLNHPHRSHDDDNVRDHTILGELEPGDETDYTILGELEPGDLIEFPRGLYSHWGVYNGNREVIHLTGTGDESIRAQSRSKHSLTSSGIRFPKTEVRIDKLSDVARGCKPKINNKRDKTWSALDRNEILDRARAEQGQKDYNLLFANCEHFAKWCRYDKRKSDQATNFGIGAGTLTGIGIVAGLLGFIGAVVHHKRNKN